MHSIDHIGIAVNSLAEAVPIFAALLGQNPSAAQDVPAESVRLVFFNGSAGRLELLEATGDDSPIAGFLTRHGPGVHHVCLATSDLDSALRRAEAHGIEVIEPKIRTGADGKRVAFLHPRSTSGVLIELAERSA
ncbi:MAG: methylmalonyl-CoA epimerase [Gemmatimonadota bacterium]|nr:methylmalonyl-CoA epimerase [Gemmatimonadota bacterium]MDH3427681.1 methylmalonyl-CoA epimerase [Gemmatimonadota bacterium]